MYKILILNKLEESCFRNHFVLSINQMPSLRRHLENSFLVFIEGALSFCAGASILD